MRVQLELSADNQTVAVLEIGGGGEPS
jgi:hypothetical protein